MHTGPHYRLSVRLHHMAAVGAVAEWDINSCERRHGCRRPGIKGSDRDGDSNKAPGSSSRRTTESLLELLALHSTCTASTAYPRMLCWYFGLSIRTSVFLLKEITMITILYYLLHYVICHFGVFFFKFYYVISAGGKKNSC